MKPLSFLLLLNISTVDPQGLDIEPANTDQIYQSLMNEICEVKLEEILKSFKNSPIVNNDIYSLSNPFTGFNYEVFFGNDSSSYIGIKSKITPDSLFAKLEESKADYWVYDRENGKVYSIYGESSIPVDICIFTNKMWREFSETSTF